MLAESLSACHSASVSAAGPLSLKLFVSGRGRLEDEGAIALAEAFKVCTFKDVVSPTEVRHLGVVVGLMHR